MIDRDGLQKLRVEIVGGDRRCVDSAVAAMGNPSPTEIASAALELLANDDRNLRVLAVRILSYYPTAEAQQGILRALSDSERRVRAVAAKSSKRFLECAQIVERLRVIVEDSREKRKIRAHAFDALSSPGEKLEFAQLPKSAVGAIAMLAQSERHRWPVLVGLLQMELNEGVVDLLKTFVKEGSREEAVMATRGLCGYRIINIGKISDQSLKKRIVSECEVAVGRVFYWVGREGLDGAVL